MTIDSFQGDHDWLSNFYPSPITLYDGLTYPTVEHAFQAMKTHDHGERHAIANVATPGKAKRMGRLLKLRPDWDEKRIPAMRYLLELKFPDDYMDALAYCLIHTGDEELIEGNHWHDTFWGVDLATGEGQNHLGKLLMERRAELTTRLSAS